jgi:cytochrome P450 PksS
LFRRWPKLELAVDEAHIKWRQRPGMRAIEQLRGVWI